MCHSENMSKIFFKIKNKKIQNDIIIVTLNCLGFPSQKQVVRFTTLALHFCFCNFGSALSLRPTAIRLFQGLVIRMCKIIICYYFFVPIILSFLFDETLPQQKHPVNVFARGERITCTPTRKKRRRLLRRATRFRAPLLRNKKHRIPITNNSISLH